MHQPLRILTIVGARPQIIKASAISRAIAAGYSGRIQETILHTGQHYDANMSRVFFDELAIPSADINLGCGSGSHGAMTACMLEAIEEVLLRKQHDVVLLYGDTNSTLAGALAASKLGVPIAHVEAGLRSFDKRMPEEVNRLVCDHCSTWLFCPTETAVTNLRKEGFDPTPSDSPTSDDPSVVLSGDVMYDNSLHFANMAEQRSRILAEIGLAGKDYILVTLHREQNTDDATRLSSIFQGLLELHRELGMALVMPLHPRTAQAMEVRLSTDLLDAVRKTAGFRILQPVGFLDMISLERHARAVITDSGGVQKEAYFFGKHSVLLRDTTEWKELVDGGCAFLADADPKRISSAMGSALSRAFTPSSDTFGDGHAAERICNELLRTR